MTSTQRDTPTRYKSSQLTVASCQQETGNCNLLFMSTGNCSLISYTSIASASSARSMMNRNRAEASRPIKSLMTRSVSR